MHSEYSPEIMQEAKDILLGQNDPAAEYQVAMLLDTGVEDLEGILSEVGIERCQECGVWRETADFDENVRDGEDRKICRICAASDEQ